MNQIPPLDSRVRGLVKKTSNWKFHFSRTQSEPGQRQVEGMMRTQRWHLTQPGGQGRLPQKLITELGLKGRGAVTQGKREKRPFQAKGTA